jgi:microcystin-dependent protein
MGISSGTGAVGFMPVGVVVPFAGSTSPAGWQLCYGQAISRTTYAGLFSTIGTTYGTGDGSTTFNVPDMRGRAVAGLDNMGGTAASRLTATVLSAANTLGATGGTETHTLTTAQLASHNHTQDSHNHTQNSHAHDLVVKYGGSQSVGVNMAAPSYSSDYGVGSGYVAGATATNQATTATNQAAGGGTAHLNTQPTIVLNYIIKAA